MKHIIVALGALMMATAVAVPAQAQLFGGTNNQDVVDAQGNIVWDKRKLERLDRNVRRLENAVQRLEGKNAPMQLVEPDPEVVALQGTVDILVRRIDDHEAVIQRHTQQVEQLQYENQQLRADLNAAKARQDQMMQRIEVLEAHAKDVDAALAGPPPSMGTAEQDFERAFDLLTTGKIDEAERAFVGFTESWPQASQLPEAWYRLGQIRGMKGDLSGTIMAYATALKGWPKTSWAPDATVRLAEALTKSNRGSDACSTLAQFTKNYEKSATVEVKNLAKSLTTRNKCK